MQNRLTAGLLACSLLGCTAEPGSEGPHGSLRLAATSSSLTLSWTDTADNEAGFEVERRPAGGTWAQVATPGVDVESYEDQGLEANTEYCYRVRAVNSAGASAYSNEACGTTLAAVDPTDPDPTDPAAGTDAGTPSLSASDTDAAIGGGCAIAAERRGLHWPVLLSLLFAVSLMVRRSSRSSLRVPERRVGACLPTRGSGKLHS